MLIRRVFASLVLSVLSLAGFDARAHELQDRADIETEAYRLLERQDFESLEALAERYRSTKARTSSGVWKLTSFYEGIRHVFYKDKRDDDHWAAAEKTARAWVEQYPNSPTAHLFYAQILDNRAWSYRGGGYADKVKPEDWPLFFEYIERERAYLEQHKSVAAQDPRWYEMMVGVAYSQGWPKARFEEMLEEGMAREPEYYPLYFAAVVYYSPRWGGSAKAIERFARKVAKRTRQIEGWGLYARIYWHASGAEFGDRLFVDSKVNWENMKKGIDDVVRRFPDDWNVASFARFACLAQDGEKAKELLDRMDEAASWLVWERRADYEKCRALAQAD